MSLPENRTELTIEEAYDLVRFYVSYFWRDFSSSLRGTGESSEDIVQDVMMKLIEKRKNRDYDPNWEPGQPAKVTKGRGNSAVETEVDTSYMLEPDYDPEDPYDSLYHRLKMPEVDYMSLYDGRTTSKKYYIQQIVQTTLIDKTRKRDRAKMSASLDQEDEDGLTLADRIPDPATIKSDFEVGDILKRIIMQLGTEPLSKDIVGWSPLTGQKDSEGNNVETYLTARDIGIFIMNNFEPSDVVQYYYNRKTGENISLSTLRKKWREALDIMRDAALNDRELRASGYLDGIMNKITDTEESQI